MVMMFAAMVPVDTNIAAIWFASSRARNYTEAGLDRDGNACTSIYSAKS